MTDKASPRLHPEDTCEDCGGPNAVWFAANDVWNRVVPKRGLVICPLCFIGRAEAAGVKCTGWELVPENYEAADD